jgi:hypothetical protein
MLGVILSVYKSTMAALAPDTAIFLSACPDRVMKNSRLLPSSVVEVTSLPAKILSTALKNRTL